MYQHICGCYYTRPGPETWSPPSRYYLPQVKLDSHTQLNPVCFTTHLTQTFHNPNTDALSEVRYTFPLYDGVAVNGYTISYSDTRLKGIVKQKDDAKKTYQDAVDRGETAGLLESLPAGVFGVTLGNVPARTDIVVEITYCGELKHDAGIDGLRYNLPTSIAPRYGQYPGEVLKSNTTDKSGIKITVDVNMAGSAIRKVMSPSHPISVSMGATSKTENSDAAFEPSQASASLALGTTELADDFVVQLLIDDISKPQAIIEQHPTIPNQRAIMTTLVPKFTLPSPHPEIVFVADQSGSMSGSKNDSLVAALKLFLKSLPIGVRFNICAFGSRFKFLWPKSKPYNETTVTEALAFAGNLCAEYGGTEILQPIQATFKQKLKDIPLEIMLLTDGEIWGENDLFSYINSEIKDNQVDARVFTLGIGGDVSHTLVEGVARAGNGFAQYVTQNEELDVKVIRMLKAALFAHTNDYSLEVHYADGETESMTDGDEDFEIIEKVNDCLTITDTEPNKTKEKATAPETTQPKSFFDTNADVDGKADDKPKTPTQRYAHLPPISPPKLLQSPSTIPPLFPFNRTNAYILLGSETTQRAVTSITLRATSADGPLELTIPVHQSAKSEVPTIHQLAAKKAVQDLEEERGWLDTARVMTGGGNAVLVKEKWDSRFDEIVEREAVRLGVEFGVVGRWTSFVAVKANSAEGGGEGAEGSGEQTSAMIDCDEDEHVEEFSSRPRRRMRAAAPMAMAMSYGKAPRKQLASKACRRSAPSSSSSPPPPSGMNAMPQMNAMPAGGNFGLSGAAPPPPPLGQAMDVERLAMQQQAVMQRSMAPQAMQQQQAMQRQQQIAVQHHSPVYESDDEEEDDGADGKGDSSEWDSSTHSSQTFGGVRRSPRNASAGGQFGMSQAAASAAPSGFSGAGGLFGAQSSSSPQTTRPVLFGGGGGGATMAVGQNNTTTAPSPFGVQALFSTPGTGPATNLNSFWKSSSPKKKQRLSDPPHVAWEANTKTLHSIIALQTFSGAWKWTPALISLLPASAAHLETFQKGMRAQWEKRQHKPNSENESIVDDISATALVLAFFSARMGTYSGVWEMVALKARGWMEGVVGGDTTLGGGGEGDGFGVEWFLDAAGGVVG